MLDKQSFYAINKANPDAIVYPNADGTDVHITRENLSEEEFLSWKKWSDTNYHETELKDRRTFDDHVVSLNEDIDASSDSLEDMLIALLDEAVYDQKCAVQLAQIRHLLTETQFRRFWKYYALGMTHQEIAIAENVGRRRITVSINDAKEKLKKFFNLC